MFCPSSNLKRSLRRIVSTFERCCIGQEDTCHNEFKTFARAECSFQEILPKNAQKLLKTAQNCQKITKKRPKNAQKMPKNAKNCQKMPKNCPKNARKCRKSERFLSSINSIEFTVERYQMRACLRISIVMKETSRWNIKFQTNLSEWVHRRFMKRHFIYFGCIAHVVGLFLPFQVTRMYFFIFHLSLADLVVAFFNIFPQMVWDITWRFQGNDLGCKVVKFLQVFALYRKSITFLSSSTQKTITYDKLSGNWRTLIKGKTLRYVVSSRSSQFPHGSSWWWYVLESCV